MLLPIIASAEDTIQVASFLKTKATGCSIDDAKAVIDKKLLDGRKISAYTTWGFIIRDGDKLRLSDLGKQLSRITNNEYSDVFQRVLRSIDAYNSALEWIFYKTTELTSITNVDIANYWYETPKFALGTENENTLKDMAVCYFKVCEAARIGRLFIGRRGQSTRLEIDRDVLGQYIASNALSKNEESSILDEGEKEITRPLDESFENENLDLQKKDTIEKDEMLFQRVVPNETTKIFISHGKNMEIVEQIKTLIELAKLDYEIVVETETAAIPVPEKVFDAMRRCNSAVICVSVDENEKKEDGEYGINQNVLIEIGSAFVLYDKKVILVWDKRISVPSNLQGLYRCEFSGDELSWATGIKLMKALNEFGK